MVQASNDEDAIESAFVFGADWPGKVDAVGFTARLAAIKLDELRGNVVKAFVVLADGYEPSDAVSDEIKSHVRERLSAYAYPRLVEFVPELPKTLTGKIRRIELRQLELERTRNGA